MNTEKWLLCPVCGNKTRIRVHEDTELNIAPRYIASIENSGQHPSLQIFYELVTLLDISVDAFFFPDKETGKSTQRRQLDSLLDEVSDKGLRIVTAMAKEVKEVETKGFIERYALLLDISMCPS